LAVIAVQSSSFFAEYLFQLRPDFFFHSMAQNRRVPPLFFEDLHRRWDTDALTDLIAENDARQLSSRSSNNSPVHHKRLKVDLVEETDEYRVYADLPGVDISDVDLEVANGMLHICAFRQQVHHDNNGLSNRIERSFGRLKRSIQLPQEAITSNADARLESGVLMVQFGKRSKLSSEKPRKVEIHASQSAAVADEDDQVPMSEDGPAEQQDSTTVSSEDGSEEK
jgi:HSP20 family protein